MDTLAKKVIGETSADSWKCCKSNSIKVKHVYKARIACHEKSMFSPKVEAWSHIQFEFNFGVDNENNFLTLHIVGKLTREECKEVGFTFKIMALDSNKKMVTLMHNAYMCRMSTTENVLPQYVGKNQSIPLDTFLCKFDHNGFAYFYIEISILLGDVYETHMPAPSTTNIEIQEELTNDLLLALHTGEYSDVTLVAGGDEIKAHKVILSMRSDVFAAMFRHSSMVESATSRVEIKDFDANVMREMLNFMYTGKVGSTLDWPLAFNLYAAADKYNLKKLKAECEIYLMSDIGIETAVKTLITADQHSDGELKLQAMKFIKDNIESIVNTESWKLLALEHSHLMVEFMSLLNF
ncbi:speckle-type POZ protein B isoform X2 [Stomoxys calcitrans]|uniref:speckle-type POZ protein B isoform X2 n=1 Tax=Stomoxys calcitrans TaxID=35570 RepID=UPI0027E2E460|nr:speckle-type POZ protein B isoform X2 [Stomoxys calcitrans]XP_059221970.1 speckle-type POZ protein B isoform X2 [Stomoxys calcitrans]XP_059221971.1 speckle-type POZ protein B isoform X2 [Stomoxys calcitrans]